MEAKGALEEQQEVLQWDEHQKAVRSMEADSKGQIEEIGRSLTALKRLHVNAGKRFSNMSSWQGSTMTSQRNWSTKKREKLKCEQQLEAVQDAVLEHIDRWITTLFAKRSESGEWHPSRRC